MERNNKENSSQILTYSRVQNVVFLNIFHFSAVILPNLSPCIKGFRFNISFIIEFFSFNKCRTLTFRLFFNSCNTSQFSETSEAAPYQYQYSCLNIFQLKATESTNKRLGITFLCVGWKKRIKMEDVNKKITLNFNLVTGGTFTVNVESDISMEMLKKIVSKKLKINKERICLMNSER